MVLEIRFVDTCFFGGAGSEPALTKDGTIFEVTFNENSDCDVVTLRHSEGEGSERVSD
jgi:hypothetical protein